jgi:hypothetical protein
LKHFVHVHGQLFFRYLPWTCLGRLAKNSVPSLHCTHFSMEQTYNLRWRRIWTMQLECYSSVDEVGKDSDERDGERCIYIAYPVWDFQTEIQPERQSLDHQTRPHHTLRTWCRPRADRWRRIQLFRCILDLDHCRLEIQKCRLHQRVLDVQWWKR